MKFEYNVGTRLISKFEETGSETIITKGKVIKLFKRYKNERELNPISKVQYTESMIIECFLENRIEIDKEFYRNQKLQE
jgi:hypothetical protein